MKPLIWAVLVAGCSAVPPTENFALPFRNPTAPVASQADVTLVRLSGAWVVVAGAGVAPGAPVVVTPTSLTIAGRPTALTLSGPGRLALPGRELWVHWLDVNNRTAVIGDPNGSVAWIMDRTGDAGERLTAARDILEWYGYDLSRFEGAEL